MHQETKKGLQKVICTVKLLNKLRPHQAKLSLCKGTEVVAMAPDATKLDIHTETHTQK